MGPGRRTAAPASAIWWKHGVIYQVYPRSFQDSDGDGIGDLPGITSRLDYLNDGTPGSLGVDAIWLSPFYPSPMADFGYDVADYRDVHPDYGTLADFDRLVEAAHRRGVRVVIDLVPNHTSDEHPWFTDSRSSRTSAKRDWYVWHDPAPDGGPPTAWRSFFQAMGPAWTLDEPTGQYYMHSFHRKQPDLNWWNPEVRREFEAILRFWLDRGVDGFRIDVADRTVKRRDPEAFVTPLAVVAEAAGADPDAVAIALGPPVDDVEHHALLRLWRRLLDEYDERMAVGEIASFDPRRVARYYGERLDELHLAFNFEFMRQPWSAEAFRRSADLFESVVPAGAWPDYALSNHDTSRARSRYDTGDGETGRRRARVGMLMLLTLRGTPFLYQGEEIGQADGVVPQDRVVDVAGRDPERTPMQWDASPTAGFTTGTPWLPVGAGAATGENAAAQAGDADSMLAFTRRAIWYRKASAALRWGRYAPLDVGDGVFAYQRDAGEERLVVALDFSGRSRTITLIPGRGTVALATDRAREGEVVDAGSMLLPADEGIVVRLGSEVT